MLYLYDSQLNKCWNHETFLKVNSATDTLITNILRDTTDSLLVVLIFGLCL